MALCWKCGRLFFTNANSQNLCPLFITSMDLSSCMSWDYRIRAIKTPFRLFANFSPIVVKTERKFAVKNNLHVDCVSYFRDNHLYPLSAASYLFEGIGDVIFMLISRECLT